MMSNVANDTVNNKIVEKIKNELTASHVGVVDNSWQHAGHAGSSGGYHLVLTIVSPKFEGLNLLERHRLVHKTLKAEMESTIHALELKLYSPAEWSNA